MSRRARSRKQMTVTGARKSADGLRQPYSPLGNLKSLGFLPTGRRESSCPPVPVARVLLYNLNPTRPLQFLQAVTTKLSSCYPRTARSGEKKIIYATDTAQKRLCQPSNPAWAGLAGAGRSRR